MLEEPKRAPLRELRELAEPLGVTPAAVYQAAKNGLIPCIPAGARRKITNEAFEYHATHGYGPSVAPYGSQPSEE